MPISSGNFQRLQSESSLQQLEYAHPSTTCMTDRKFNLFFLVFS